LNALACNTATHNLFTSTSHTRQIGVSRVGAGRVDLTNANNASVVAFNGDDPGLIGVSFGVVETPVSGTMTPTKHITVENKGASNVTYNLSIQTDRVGTAADPNTPGARFSFPNGSGPITINAGDSMSIPVQFSATGNALRHNKEASVSFFSPSGTQG